jgi:hypothetical protein
MKAKTIRAVDAGESRVRRMQRCGRGNSYFNAKRVLKLRAIACKSLNLL